MKDKADILIECDVVGLNHYPPHICNGVLGIDAKIDQDLVDLGGIHFDIPPLISDSSSD